MNPLILPAGFDSDHVPAVVLTSEDGKRALVWHACGESHKNRLATIARLRRQSIEVLNAPSVAAA